MSRSPHHHNAEKPFQASTDEAERLARAEKNARLKKLRTHASWLVLDPQAHFQEEIEYFGSRVLPLVRDIEATERDAIDPAVLVSA